MTTDYNGPTSTIVQYPSLNMGFTIHEGAHQVMDSRPGDAAIAPSPGSGPEKWYSGLGSLAGYIDPKFYAPFLGNEKNTRSYGKPLIVTQGAGLFHGVDMSKVPKDYTEEQKQTLKLQKATQYIKFGCVLQDSFNNDYVPQDGVMGIVSGPVTVKIPVNKSFNYMTRVVFAMAQSAHTNRVGSNVKLSDGPDKSSFTLEEYNERSPTDLVRHILTQYAATLENAKNGGRLPFQLGNVDGTVQAVLLEDERDAAQLTVGAMAVSMSVIETLIDEGFLTFNALPQINDKQDVDRSKTWRDTAPSLLGLSKPTNAQSARPIQATSSMLSRTIKKIIGRHKTARVSTTTYKTIQNSAFTFLLNAVQDVGSKSNKIIGDVIRRTPNAPIKNGKGEFDVYFRN